MGGIKGNTLPGSSRPYKGGSFNLSGRGRVMSCRICIVDHDLASRGYLRECLEREGHQITTVDNGSKIKSLLSEETFNIFILNVDTPGVREKNLLLEIKKSHQTRILLIVSERGDAFLKEAIDLGVYGFIYKPFKLDEICTMVTHLAR
jgi:two-component system copper resistance phosphate regulon response regulator CusR